MSRDVEEAIRLFTDREFKLMRAAAGAFKPSYVCDDEWDRAFLSWLTDGVADDGIMVAHVLDKETRDD